MKTLQEATVENSGHHASLELQLLSLSSAQLVNLVAELVDSRPGLKQVRFCFKGLMNDNGTSWDS